ncbi:unnamed protein product [Linum tenue]|uniref:BHLH domain-containing protein n=1 Tax=Linum tenue TaxID=586396 RepID=A0AAV0MR51_9ROSI|nr:unnamed protein product [Linum tenue]
MDLSIVLEFNWDIAACLAKGRAAGRMAKPLTTERQRRQQVNDKFDTLRNLIPNPTKELLSTVEELKLLVEKKRCSRWRIKRHRTDQEDVKESSLEEMKASSAAAEVDEQDKSYNGSTLRSAWLHFRGSLRTRRLMVLDELHLDLHHVARGHVGDFYSFLFNTKICEGSSVYASAIANKLIEVVDKQLDSCNSCKSRVREADMATKAELCEF